MANTTSLKLDPELRERIERIAEARERSAHWIMKRAIEEYVEQAETEEDFRKRADEAWEHYQRTGLHVTNDEVMEWLDRLARGERVPRPKAHR